MKAYKVIYSHSAPSIEEIEVQEFGVHFLNLNGKWHRTRTQFYAWVETKEEAMECLLNYAKYIVIQAERDLEIAKKYLNKVEQFLK